MNEEHHQLKGRRRNNTIHDVLPAFARIIIVLLVANTHLVLIQFSHGYQLSSFTGSALSLTTHHKSSQPYHRHPWTMKLRVGILGLPNVGKSSLFNALARQSLAQAANFPFCTIDPTTCLVPCPDPYLDRLADWSSPQPLSNNNDHRHGHRRRVSSTMEWVDVAGLAKNAHRGEGLGNQFLGTLRDCTCLCHVVRAFDDPTILVHSVEEDYGNNDNPKNSLLCDPLRDLETIQLELVLADQAHVQRRLERIRGGQSTNRNSKQESDDEEERKVLERIELALQEGIPARALGLTGNEKRLIKSMGLLSLKPVVYAFNVDEVDFFLNRQEAEEKARQVVETFEQQSSSFGSIKSGEESLLTAEPSWALVCANVESHLAQCTAEEQSEYLKSIGADQTRKDDEDGRDEDALPSLCYQVLPNLVKQLLGYSIIYTGPGVPLERSQTTRAHLFRQSSSSGEEEKNDDGDHDDDDVVDDSSSSFTAYDLAGRIHGNIQKGFLRAQVVSAAELLEQASDFVQAKELGILRAEGKDYALQDGEVVYIQWKQG